MTLAMHILNPLRKICDLAYRSSLGSKQPHGFSGAVSHLISYGMQGEYPEQKVDMSKVVISKGKLVKPYGAYLSAQEGKVVMHWQLTENPSQWLDDEAIGVLYNEEKDVWQIIRHEAVRSDLQLTVSLPPEFDGDTLHGYLFFLCRSEKNCSPSVYLPPVRFGGV